MLLPPAAGVTYQNASATPEKFPRSIDSLSSKIGRILPNGNGAALAITDQLVPDLVARPDEDRDTAVCPQRGAVRTKRLREEVVVSEAVIGPGYQARSGGPRDNAWQPLRPFTNTDRRAKARPVSLCVRDRRDRYPADKERTE
jgi:hypothetical protein